MARGSSSREQDGDDGMSQPDRDHHWRPAGGKAWSGVSDPERDAHQAGRTPPEAGEQGENARHALSVGTDPMRLRVLPSGGDPGGDAS